jgi:hypothetical protein
MEMEGFRGIPTPGDSLRTPQYFTKAMLLPAQAAALNPGEGSRLKDQSSNSNSIDESGAPAQRSPVLPLEPEFRSLLSSKSRRGSLARDSVTMKLDYKSIFKELNRLKIDYLIVGGLAVNFHGVPRLTYDIDLMISFEAKNVLKLVKKLQQWGFNPKVPIDPRDLSDEGKRVLWVREKNMRAVHFYNDHSPIGEIDILIDFPIPYSILKDRAVLFDLEGEKIPTVSIHDLIELKRRAGRKQDLSDVEHLKIILEK